MPLCEKQWDYVAYATYVNTSYKTEVKNQVSDYLIAVWTMPQSTCRRVYHQNS
jgi:hypothetical protein